jgi:glycosyltransferase involved in cell wall biosynthesis
MPATLRVVLDQLAVRPAGQLAEVSREVARALVRTAPNGCEVVGIVPALPGGEVAAIRAEVPGVADVERAPLPRRELLAAWQLGIVSGIGRGLIHSPTVAAPLVKHDPVNDNDQTVLTLWDLAAWEHPDSLGRSAVALHKGMLKRAVRHADAVVVPTHAHAERLAGIARLGGRVRVIAGAAPAGFAVPSDDVGRRRLLDLPAEYLLVSAGATGIDEAFEAIARAVPDAAVVVVDVAEGDEAVLVERGAAAGIREAHIHPRGALNAGDRAAALAGATAFVTPATDTAFPWRLVEALAIGVPVVAADSAVHRQVLVDGGSLADGGAEGLAEALRRTVSSDADRRRFAVLAADRGRAFSWTGHAERVWQLHADL